MGITIAEKQHWKERLASRIDRAIKDLYQAKAPDLRKQVKAEAADMVKEKFGIKELCDRADELDSKKRSIKKQYLEALDQIAIVLKNHDHDIRTHYHSLSDCLKMFIDSEAVPLERVLLQQTDVGLEALRLEEEKEQLLDTVWLATSPTQIRDLWNNLNQILSQVPTQLQLKVMDSPPLESTDE